MKVVGYAYDADTHCVDCTREYVQLWSNDPEGDVQPDSIEDVMDGKVDFHDGEGNPIHPIFSIDEAGDTPTHCGDCGMFIDDSWTFSTVDYAVESIEEFLDGNRGYTSTLEVWAENLKWCIISDHDREVVDRFWEKVQKEQYEA
jgi:hypothetical protein